MREVWEKSFGSGSSRRKENLSYTQNWGNFPVSFLFLSSFHAPATKQPHHGCGGNSTVRKDPQAPPALTEGNPPPVRGAVVPGSEVNPAAYFSPCPPDFAWPQLWGQLWEGQGTAG